jgi:hypothetical protein
MTMPFQVYLMPTTASPPDAEVQTAVRAAISTEGGSLVSGGVVLRASDGVEFKVAGDLEHFAVERLSPSFCQIMFNAALTSNSTVDRAGSDVTPLKMKGSRGATRFIRMHTDPIADPVALCARLGRDLQDWNHFIADSELHGVLGPDEQPLEPPPTPGTEIRLETDTSGVAAHCEATQEAFAKLGWKIVRKVVTQNAQYGVVWRANVTIPGYRNEPSRITCWRRPGRGEYSTSDRPLEMFDPAESIPPLGR